MLRIQAPATITQCENIFTRYLQNFFVVHFTVHVHMYILKGYINWKIETRQKEKFLYYIVLRKHWNPFTVHSIQSVYCSMQRANERHSRSKLSMTLLGVTITITAVKILLLLCIPPFYAFTSHFLAKYFWFGICKFSLLLLLWLIVGNAALKQSEQPTSRQICAKSTSFPWSCFFLP